MSVSFIIGPDNDTNNIKLYSQGKVIDNRTSILNNPTHVKNIIYDGQEYILKGQHEHNRPIDFLSVAHYNRPDGLESSSLIVKINISASPIVIEQPKPFNVELVVFPVETDETFTIPYIGPIRRDPPKLESLRRKREDWSSSDLTTRLKNQIYNNAITLFNIAISCDYDPPNVISYNKYEDDSSDESFNYVELADKDEKCAKFKHIKRDYIETLSRDHDAIREHHGSPLYAVVCLYNGEYSGHVYAWKSVNDSDKCLMMGIRNRVDTVFIKDTDQYLPSISKYLIMGVTKLAEKLQCATIHAAHPLPTMMLMLYERYNWYPQDLEAEVFADSISPPTPCLMCPTTTVTDIELPFYVDVSIYD